MDDIIVCCGSLDRTGVWEILTYSSAYISLATNAEKKHRARINASSVYASFSNVVVIFYNNKIIPIKKNWIFFL